MERSPMKYVGDDMPDAGCDFVGRHPLEQSDQPQMTSVGANLAISWSIDFGLREGLDDGRQGIWCQAGGVGQGTARVDVSPPTLWGY
jgi:hypothetical protein